MTEQNFAERDTEFLPRKSIRAVSADVLAESTILVFHLSVAAPTNVYCEKMLTADRSPVFIGHMRIKSIGLLVVFCCLAGGVCFAADPLMGTWKLNETKSKITPGTAKFTTISFKDRLRNIKGTGDGIDANGKPMHIEWSGKFDGKDYPVTGDPNADTRSYRKVDDRTLEVTIKKGGKVTVTSRTVVSADGKSRTANITGTTPNGKKFKNVAVYDKQ